MKNIFITCFLTLSFCSYASFEEATSFSELGIDKIFKTSPKDDPKLYPVEDAEYKVKASPFLWVIPGPGSFSKNIISQKSNNNVAIEFYQNRLFLAFRTAPRHFASRKARMYVISTSDGINWDLEWKSTRGRDVRSPQLVSFNGQLHFYYLTAGSFPLRFNPKEVFKTSRSSFQNWSTPMQVMEKGEVPWEMKVRGNMLWMTSYRGRIKRFMGGAARLKLQLKKSSDGMNFYPENEARVNVSLSGASEAGFEFDDEGNLWGVTKNEHGDESGYGAHLVYSPSNLLSYWSMLSLTKSYHSPRLFRHGKDIYLIARRNIGSESYSWSRRGGHSWRRMINWSRYSMTPKTTALFKMNQQTQSIEHVMDLPGAGDTAYPSIRRVDKDTFLVANYSSPLNLRNRRWFVGKLGHTKIYLMTLKFEKVQ